MAQLREKVKQQLARPAQALTAGLGNGFRLVLSAIRETLKPETSVTAAAIAYFSLFSFFPLTLLSIAIASYSLGSSLDAHLIIQRLEFIAPAVGDMLGENIDGIIEARGSITVVALLGMVWSASSVFYTFTHTLHGIWGGKERRSVWKRRGLAILLVLTLIGPLLLLTSMAGSMAAHLRAVLPASILVVEAGLSRVLAVLLNVALFMLLYMTLPRGKSTWRAILPGAIAAGFLWEVAKWVFLSFVSTYMSVSNLVYGSVTTIIAFLLWAYLSGLIFLFGAYLSVAYSRFMEEGGGSGDVPVP
ncbi:MAG: YihY/virulence factor BrkB family protein [Anaerolineae bacterium]|nr:MAG: YihY/virulence factor BrkB family protein [Anaerolineae bacterium]